MSHALLNTPRTLFTPQAVKAAMGASNAKFPELDLLNFKLVKRPLYIEDETPNKVMDGIVMAIPMDQQHALLRDDTMVSVHFAGKDYKIVQMQELHDTVEAAFRLKLPTHILNSVQLTEKTSNVNFFRAEYRIPGLAAVITHPTGKSIKVEFDVTVENQATHSVKMTTGARDTSCDNALVFDNTSLFSKGHTPSFSTDGFQRFLTQQIDEFTTKITTLREWNKTAVDEVDFEIVMRETGVLSDSMIAKIIEQYNEEIEERGCTKFAAYSALTAYCTHNNERFYVKGSADKDNEAVGMSAREDHVRKIVSDKAWKGWS